MEIQQAILIYLLVAKTSGLDHLDSSSTCSFVHETLLEHNRYRYIHGVSPIRFNDQLQTKAVQIVQQVASQSDKSFEDIASIEYELNVDESNWPNGIGSNILFMRNCSHASCCNASIVTSIFYNEIEFYSYVDYKSTSAHYTGNMFDSNPQYICKSNFAIWR